MKRRSLTLVLCLLATLSLASVGFASWVISAGDTENATGQISVDTVTDNRIMITEIKIGGSTWNGTGWTGTAPKFVFGKPANGVDFWLKNDQNTEVLELTLSFKVVKVDGGDAVDNAQTSVILAAAEGTNFGNWIAVDTPTAETQNEVTNKGNGNYECTLRLKWGSAWYNADADANVNPYLYFADQAVDGEVYVNDSYEYEEVETDGYELTTWGQFAVDKLKAMQLALASAQFKITIDAQPAAQNQNQN